MDIRKLIYILLAIVMILPTQNVYSEKGTKYYDFGIRSPEDMPKIPGCSDDHDEILYYGGIASGVDPALLKAIARVESNGVSTVVGSKNSNGTTDYGLMQINSGGFATFGLSDTPEDRQKLIDNVVLNVWAGTETVKWKYGTLDRNITEGNMKGNVKIGKNSFLMSRESFSILWAYNGISKKGREYAKKAHNFYMDATNLPKQSSVLSDTSSIETPILMGLLFDVVRASGGNIVVMEKVVTNPESMSYAKFAEIVEDISDGKIIPSKQPMNESARQKAIAEAQKAIHDMSTGTGVYNEQTDGDIVINYKFYKIIKSAITIINYIINMLAYLMILIILIILIIGLLWSLYVLALTGFKMFNDILINMTGIDSFDEGSMKKMIVITSISTLIIAVVVTGVGITILEKIVLKVMQIRL